MPQWLLRSDTVIYEAATQRPVDELVLTFHLVYRQSSVCQFPARLYLGHSTTTRHWSQRSLTERRSCKHIVNLSGVNSSQVDGRHMGPTNRSCKHSLSRWWRGRTLCLPIFVCRKVTPGTSTTERNGGS